MRLRYAFRVIILLIVITALSLWLFFQPLAHTAAEKFLSTLGLSHFSFERVEVNLKGATFHTLEASYPLSEGQISLNAARLSITYDLASLLRNFNRPSIKLSHALIQLPAGREGSPELWLPETALLYTSLPKVPFSHIELEEISLERPSSTAFNFSGVVTRTSDNSLSVVLDSKERFHASGIIESFPEETRLSIHASLATLPIQAKLHVLLTDNGITLSNDSLLTVPRNPFPFGMHNPIELTLVEDVLIQAGEIALKLPIQNSPIRFSHANFALSCAKSTWQVVIGSGSMHVNLPDCTFNPVVDSAYQIESGVLRSTLSCKGFHFGECALTSALKDASLTIGTSRITGINAETTLQITPTIQFKGPLLASAKELALPVPLTNAALKLQIENFSSLRVLAASTEMLGGTLAASNAEINLATSTLTSDLQISHLSLSELMKLYPQEAVEVTGALNAKGSLLWQKGALQANLTELRSEAPGGIIKYQHDPSLPVDSRYQFALEPLEDFRYQEISGNGDLKEDGTLTLALLIKGSNPSWQSGRAVHLNLTLSENVKELIRSIRLARGDSDEVKRSVEDSIK